MPRSKSGRTKPARPAPIFSADRTLAFLSAAIGVALTLYQPKTGTALVLWLAVLFACLIQPTLHFVKYMIGGRLAWLTVVVALFLEATGITVFGTLVWPHPRRHLLTGAERAAFENVLRQQQAEREHIAIACPAYDEPTCVYAAQFVSIFGEAGWKVERDVGRYRAGRSPSGVVLTRRVIGPEPHEWNQGNWSFISERIQTIGKAFRAIGAEADGGGDLNLADNTIRVYFGPEADNPTARTSLTESLEVLERMKREGSITQPSKP